jgi:hypothetical protein
MTTKGVPMASILARLVRLSAILRKKITLQTLWSAWSAARLGVGGAWASPGRAVATRERVREGACKRVNSGAAHAAPRDACSLPLCPGVPHIVWVGERT